MIGRRGVIMTTLLGGAALASPASACRAPATKDRGAYAKAIDGLFSAWWSRDYAGFQRAFQHVDVQAPFEGRALFDAHYRERHERFRGELLFNGASVIAQVVTPEEADAVHGICGGYASADLFFVEFFPGLNVPVMERVHYVGSDLLAEGEWSRPTAALGPTRSYR